MQISDMPELKAADIRNEMNLVIEDGETTYRITAGELKKWLTSNVTPITKQMMNQLIDDVTESLKELKQKPEFFEFSEDPVKIKWDQNSDPYGSVSISYNRPEQNNYRLSIKNVSTGDVIFVREIEDAIPMINASFLWKLRDYSSIEQANNPDLLFKDGFYFYNDADVNNSNILIIENNNDKIIPAGTELLITISTESNYISLIYIVSPEDVEACMVK